MRKTILLAPLVALSLSGCGPVLRAFTAGAPPQAPAAVMSISRTALDFSLNAFDAALYGLDFAMDAGRLTPGSEPARRIAAAGRRVMNFLGAAEAARDLGSSATYEQAFANAKTALDEFRSLFPARASFEQVPPMTNDQRAAILDRLEGHGGGSIPRAR
jgi:hypothetical protein